jgi:hypothetical protein
MKFLVEIEQEVDGRWIADRIENGEAGPDLATIKFEAA